MSMRFVNLLGEEGSTVELKSPPKRLVTVDPRIDGYLNRAMRKIAQRWLEFSKGENNGFLHPDITDGMAEWHFIRAKYLDADYPRYMSLAFSPRQFATQGDKDGSSRDILEKLVASDPKGSTMEASLRWLMGDEPESLVLFYSPMGIRSMRMPADFPAVLARGIYEEFCPQGGAVLDPCHGWGGRFIGFLLADKPCQYVGIDPSPIAHEALGKIAASFFQYVETKQQKKWSFQKLPYEDAALTQKFDFALTSPPYFDTEKYDGTEQSFRKFKTYPAWREGFYRLLIERTYRTLKPGARFCLNIGSKRYPLLKDGIELAKGAGFIHERTIDDIVKRDSRYVGRADMDMTGEVMLVLKKGNK